MPRRTPLHVFAALALVGMSPPILARAQGAPFEATTLTLSATGEAEAAPDIANISIGVENTGATAAQALRANALQMFTTIAALKARGVATKDIQTSGLNLSAQYVFHDNEPRKLSGYQASNTVTVTVRDLARLGETVDGVVAAGANQINGVSFGLSDSHAAEDEARRAAVKALQAKATLYAEATGYHVARLVSLSDGGGSSFPRPPLLPGAPKFAAATPTEPGELKLTATVSAVFELKQ
jgi:uncharacterized protein YggE